MGTNLTGIFPALVTPLHDDETVNVAAFEKLLGRVYAAGVDGVYVCGSTGEGTLLPEAERRKIVEAATASTPDGKSVIVHVGSWSLAESDRLARHAAARHAAAISCIRPSGVSYVEMLAWYRALAAATSLPFFAYYFPASTGDPLSLDQLEEICGLPGVAGIKYTDYDLYVLSLLARQGFRLFNGRDEVLAAGLLMGACGGIGSIYNLVPEWFVELHRLARTGQWNEARALQDRINDLIRVLLRFPFLSGLKTALTWQGIDCGNVVRPRTTLSAAQEAQLRAALEPLGILAGASV